MPKTVDFSKAILDVIEELNEKEPAVKTGTAALMACGMQPEFAAHLMLMQQSFQTSIILRAGSPPIYDRPRAPKSGLNLSKTSNQGFFKGAIAKEPLFTRLEEQMVESHGKPIKVRIPKGHHKKDAEKLTLKNDPQPTTILPIRLRDMIRELSDAGDLQMSGYIPGQEIRFCYKKDRGPSDFKGEFTVKLNKGEKYIAIESREWDKQKDPKNAEQPPGFNMNKEDWQKFYALAQDKEFPLYFKHNKDDPTEIVKPAEVFSDQNKLIIAGDWDGLALGHRPNLPSYATKVYDTFHFSFRSNKHLLLNSTKRLLAYLKQEINEKERAGIPLTQYEQTLMKIRFNKALYSDFSLSRAGCITPFEFLNNSVANYLYKEKENDFLRNEIPKEEVQQGFSNALNHARKLIKTSKPIPSFKKILTQAMGVAKETIQPKTTNLKILEHLEKMLIKEISADLIEYANRRAIVRGIPNITHPDYDPNIQNLFQHGYDMRNPYSLNLDGAWLLITHSGQIIYGKTEEQLTKVILTGDYLEKNYFDINPDVNMAKGWGQVVEKQIEFGYISKIPAETMKAYNAYQLAQATAKSLQPAIKAQKSPTPLFQTVKIKPHEPDFPRPNKGVANPDQEKSKIPRGK